MRFKKQTKVMRSFGLHRTVFGITRPDNYMDGSCIDNGDSV